MTVDREAILREWWGPDGPDGWTVATKAELLDLISRAVDAAYEDAAKVAEGELAPFPCRRRRCLDERCKKAAAVTSAIRALIGGGE